MTEYSHETLQHKLLPWLNNKSWQLRFCTEATLGEKCVVDAAAIFIPKREHRIKIGLDDANIVHTSVVFEVKISKPDFNCTFGNSAVRARDTLANIHWIVTNQGLVTPNMCPDPWGLLEPRGSGLRIIKLPTICKVSYEQMNKIAWAILWKHEPWWRQREIESLAEHYDPMQEESNG